MKFESGKRLTILLSALLATFITLSSSYAQLIMNFSAATTSATTQEIIEASMEKRSKDKLGPMGGKQLIIFIDGMS